MKKAISNTGFINAIASEGGKTLYRFCVSDERINRNGWKIITDGIDFANFLLNPVILFGHDSWSFPIGKAENIFVQDSKLFADIWLHEDTEQAKTTKKLIENGVINATSIGISVAEKGEPLPIPQELKDSFPYSQFIEVFTKSELYEISVVVIPANAGATIQERVQNALIDGSINGQDLEFINQIIKNNEDEMANEKTDAVRTAEVDTLLKENGALTGKIGELGEEIKTLKANEKAAIDKAATLENALQAKELEIATLRENQITLEVDAFIAKNSRKIMPKENENDILKNKLIALKQSGLKLITGETYFDIECKMIGDRKNFAGLGEDLSVEAQEQASKEDLTDVEDYNKKKFGRGK